jgi:DNA gyrase subunit A
MDVTEKDGLMISCKSGVTIRMAVGQISEQGRATQGVKLIRVDEGDEIAAITRVDEEEPEVEQELPTDEITGDDENSQNTDNQTTE